MVDTNVFKLAQPGTFTDSLTEILRSGARALLTQAVEAEVGDFLHRHADLKTEAGRRRLVRHGHLPEREIMTGIGPVAVRQPRLRDRAVSAGERIRFNPAILPECRTPGSPLQNASTVLELNACWPLQAHSITRSPNKGVPKHRTCVLELPLAQQLRAALAPLLYSGQLLPRADRSLYGR